MKVLQGMEKIVEMESGNYCMFSIKVSVKTNIICFATTRGQP